MAAYLTRRRLNVGAGFLAPRNRPPAEASVLLHSGQNQSIEQDIGHFFLLLVDQSGWLLELEQGRCPIRKNTWITLC